MGRIERLARFMLRHWLFMVNLLVGLYAALPWLSPLARALGWDFLGQAIFMLFRPPVCHQQPDLSYHIFGYQVAYCHRDTAIYTTIFLAGLLFGLVRRRCQPLRWWALLLLTLPIVIDGVTQTPRSLLPSWPLRTENPWAVWLTGGILPRWFYAGDAIGSLNWWLRTVTGALFGLGLVLAFYPRIEAEAVRGLAVATAPLAPTAPRSPRGTSVGTGPAAAPGAGGSPPPAVGAGLAPASPDDRRRRRPGAAGS
jgi:uncharacterized membrane protein